MTALSHRRLLVNVDSPSGRHILEVPEDARMEDLIPSVVEACERGSDPAGWRLAPMGEAPLEDWQTLAERGLFPGAVLELVAPDEPGQAASAPSVPSASDLARKLRAKVQSFAPTGQPWTGMPNIERMGDADYLRLLDAAIVTPTFGASTVVAVMSAHSGTGTTTISVLLATLVCTLRSDEVGVVDARPQSGALSHWMAPESGLSRDTYDTLFDPQLLPEQVRKALVKIGPNLAILPAPSDHSGKPAADQAAWGRLIEHLRHLHHIVIIDCGAGFQHAVSRAVLEAADQVVLVSKSTPGDLDRLGPTIESIRGQGRTVVVVSNHANQRARSTRSASGIQQVTLAHEPQAAQRLKTRGFSWSDAPYSWQEAIRELAAVLVGTAQSSPPPVRGEG
jgi:MinD-like ATPase involved in chromosome partitioning or flagellar assembly